MKLVVRIFAVVLVFVSFVLAMPAEVYAMTPTEKSVEEQLIIGINAERTKAGLSELKYDKKMQAGADTRVKEVTSKWSHTRPNGEDYYTADAKRIYGENLAKDYSSVDALMTGWMASPTHKENILFGDFASVAIGVIKLDNGTYVVACEFGY